MKLEPEKKGLSEVLAINLKDFRKFLGLTMVDVSKGMGISQPYLSQIENAKKDIGLSNLGKLITFFMNETKLSYNSIVYLLLNEDYDIPFDEKFKRVTSK